MEAPSSAGPHTPRRTCVGCRQTTAASALVRLLLADGRLMVVRRARPRPAGRGAWVHPSRACLDAAVRVRAFDRAFRTPVGQVDVESVMAALTEATTSTGTR